MTGSQLRDSFQEYKIAFSLFDPDDKIELETSEACWRINQKGDQKGNCGEGVTCTEANSRFVKFFSSMIFISV